jgi:hypothetical protein
MKQHERQQRESSGCETRLEQEIQPEPIAGMPGTAISAAKGNCHTRKASKGHGEFGDSDQCLGIV